MTADEWLTAEAVLHVDYSLRDTNAAQDRLSDLLLTGPIPAKKAEDLAKKNAAMTKCLRTAMERLGVK